MTSRTEQMNGDVAKCNGCDCPLKETCLRYTVKAGEYQWWTEGAYNNETNECSLKLPIARKLHPDRKDTALDEVEGDNVAH